MKKTFEFEIVLRRVYVGQILTTAGINDDYDYPVCLRCMNAEGNYEYEDLPDFIYLQYQELIEEKRCEACRANDANDVIVIGHINVDTVA